MTGENVLEEVIYIIKSMRDRSPTIEMQNNEMLDSYFKGKDQGRVECCIELLIFLKDLQKEGKLPYFYWRLDDFHKSEE